MRRGALRRPAAALLLALACAHPPPPRPTVTAAAPPRPRPAVALAGAEPVYPPLDGASQPPALLDPACLAPALADEALPPRPGALALRFALGPDGAPGAVEVADDGVGAGPPTLAALEAALRACRWIPGRDGRGLRAPAPVRVEFRFAPRP
jgi:hypothetical protein